MATGLVFFSLMSIPGFSQLQSAESRLVAAALADERAGRDPGWNRRPDWLLELAPVSGPSPAMPIGVARHRVLFDREGIVWPYRARLDEWPLDSESVPAVMLRHVWQPGLQGDPLSEALRVLRPGGWLISVSANPWHRRAWQVLGRQALMLPSWPRWQWQHARHELELSAPAAAQWRGLVPGLSPVLLLLARKPQRPGGVVNVSFKMDYKRRLAAGSMPAANCRAA